MKLEFLLPFYNYYAVAAAFFQKEYWVYLWKDSPSTVDESYQLKKATKWAMKNNSRYAKTSKEITKTSFITSATHTYKDIDLDIFHFNYHLNEAWLSGNLNAMDNFPNDLRVDYIKSFLDSAGDNKSTSVEWLKWVGNFKEQYRKIGCNVD
jgi:hypothetical protein